MPPPPRDQVFVSYSHKDKKWLEKLQTMLKPLVRKNSISVWDDTRIGAGAKWREEIKGALDAAKVAVLLVSPNFLISDFIAEHELPPILNAAEKQGLVILWVCLSSCLYDETEVRDYQAAHDISKPLDSLTPAKQSAVLANVCRTIAAAANPSVGPSLEAAPGAAGHEVALSNIPDRNPFFTGREQVLAELQEALAAQGRAALSGLGGVGKTQTAVEYAHRHLEEYSHFFLVNADSLEALVSGYVTIAGLLKLPESEEKDQTIAFDTVKRWLSSHEGWLLILDNADDLGMARTFIPPGKNGHVLLTTRAQALGAVARRIDIQEMGTEEGSLLLLRRAKYIAEDAVLEATDEDERAQAKEIALQLDGLPLALDQAGAYIEETGCGLSGYLDLYRSHAPELLRRRGALTSDQPPVATTWALSFEKIERTNPAAAELLRFCAFLHPDGIPEEVFSKGAPELGPVLGTAGSDTLALHSALSEILKYSLLRRDPSARILEIPRLVQAVLKQAMDEATQRRWAERAVRAVNRAFPEVEFSTWAVCDRLLPQARACAELINRWSFEFPEGARLLNKAGSYLYERGRYTDAKPLYERALAILENALGPEHPHVATSLNNVAELYRAQGQYAKAEPLCERALAIREKALGPEHPGIAISLNNLALLYYTQGRYTKAKPLYQRALATFEKALGPEHPDVANCLNSLAELYRAQGQYAKAEPLCERALAIFEKALGPEHPDVANSLNSLGKLYSAQGRYAKAEPLCERALAIFEKALGPEHPHVATCLNSLALLYYTQGQYAKAEPFYERALAILEKALGPEHPDVATSINNLAELYDTQGQYAKAEPLYARALAIRNKVLGPAHPENIAAQRIQVSARLGTSFLDLTRLTLRVLPESIGQLTQLERLDLSENELTALPDSIGQLVQLRFLNLGANGLPELPESICQLTKLEILDLSKNQLTALPESIHKLARLQTLDLSENNITALPYSIGQLVQLRFLNLGANRLSELPESIGQLTQLEVLDLSKNQLTALPESIHKLAQLQFLSLAENVLLELPEWVAQLAELKALDLRENQLTDIPKSLRQLSRLTQICLDANDALGPEILQYYFRVRGGQWPLNEAKLILVGRGGVGKTSLVNRLVHGQFHNDEQKTDGICITQWKLRLRDKEGVRLHIWDFGGQEIMHATHQFFLTERSLYLLVLNGREGGEDMDAEYWLQLTESFGAESSVIVVLNKIKEHSFSLNQRGLQKKYSSIREFIKTDCQDKTGLNELRAAIERETDRLAHLRDAFPGAWFSIKERLSGMKENYVSFERYRELCEKLGEKDPKAQEELAGYLHELGIALNFKDDPRLQDTHVLNPHWVTNGIYKILNAEKLAEQHGVLRLSDLATILDARTYPLSKHRFILDLMKKFDLCFEFPDDPSCRYLVPELLDKEEADLGTTFKPDECLNFQYHYSILPEGLLPRFIVRTQILSTQLRWRTGVVLEFEGNRALVKADIQERKVFISISGPVEGRRRLLAIIRSDFDRIHTDIKKLQPMEMVPIKGRADVVIPYAELKVWERNEEKKFRKVVDNMVIEVDVQEMLNGVDLEVSHGASVDRGEGALLLFFSYSHEDETLRKKLETHLKLLQRQGLISTWHDRKISAGEEWKGKIDDNLEKADIILLMVSAAFINSDYCWDREMNRALERHHGQQARVIPVILRDVDWQGAAFGKFQALPKNGKPIMLWRSKDSAWKDVAVGIRKVVEEMRDNRSRNPRVSTRSSS